MRTFSQNNEDQFVLNYFGNYIGRLLDIGANDGVTFSNSKLLIEHGWEGHLLEPGSICKKLFVDYNDNENIFIYNFGIGERDEVVKFWESGAHVPNGTDIGLVSTTDFEETKRWPDVKFEQKAIRIKPFSCLEQYAPFDFISIDCEGMEWKILKQIDLSIIGCSVLCIEFNGDKDKEELFTNYCSEFGLGLALKNAENLIFTKK